MHSILCKVLHVLILYKVDLADRANEQNIVDDIVSL